MDMKRRWTQYEEKVFLTRDLPIQAEKLKFDLASCYRGYLEGAKLRTDWAKVSKNDSIRLAKKLLKECGK